MQAKPRVVVRGVIFLLLVALGIFAAGPWPAISDEVEYRYTSQPGVLFATPEQQAALGRLSPAAALTLLEQREGWLNVRIYGWQQDEAPPLLYALMGIRIRVAVLNEEGQQQVQKLSTFVDPETELVWHESTLTGWVMENGLLTDREVLWETASQLYQESCSRCHALHGTDEFYANQWPNIVETMRKYTILDDNQIELLAIYLQFHARDTDPQSGVEEEAEQDE